MWEGPSRLQEARKIVQEAYPSYTVEWDLEGYRLIEWTNDRKWTKEMNDVK